MTIFEYADIIDKDLDIKYYSNQDGRFTADLDGAEVKDGIMLVGAYGDSSSVDGAINDYISKIAGKTLVFHAYGDKRQEFKVPKNIRREGDSK